MLYLVLLTFTKYKRHIKSEIYFSKCSYVYELFRQSILAINLRILTGRLA